MTDQPKATPHPVPSRSSWLRVARLMLKMGQVELPRLNYEHPHPRVRLALKDLMAQGLVGHFWKGGFEWAYASQKTKDLVKRGVATSAMSSGDLSQSETNDLKRLFVNAATEAFGVPPKENRP